MMRISAVAKTVFFGSAILVGFWSLVGAALGAHYYRASANEYWSYMVAVLVVLIGLGVLVIWRPEAGIAHWTRLIVLGLAGLGFTGAGAYLMVVDPGDFWMWVWPFLMGASLIVLTAVSIT